MPMKDDVPYGSRQLTGNAAMQRKQLMGQEVNRQTVVVPSISLLRALVQTSRLP